MQILGHILISIVIWVIACTAQVIVLVEEVSESKAEDIIEELWVPICFYSFIAVIFYWGILLVFELI